MSSVMYTVLSTEMTSIPSSMQSILGHNFDNTLCNGVTWLFVIWTVLHSCYDKLMNVYLKQLGFTQYLRTRLSNSLWLLAVFASFFAYYVLTIDEYDICDMMNFRRNIDGQYGNVPSYKMLAHAIICSYYLHMAYTQGLQLGSLHFLSTFVVLTIVCTTAYILRLLEISFTVTALVAITGTFEELSKMSYTLLNKGNKFGSFFINFLYISSVVLFSIVYFAIIPVSFLLPLGMKLFSGTANFLSIILFTSLLCWLNLVIYKSIVLNSIFHWLYHLRNVEEKEEDEDEKQTMKLGCFGHIIGCSLFPTRTDPGYILAYLRSETKRRQRRMLAKRKPKNRSMLIQTMICMMALKKKLNEKKAELQGTSSDENAEHETFDDEISDEMAEANLANVKKSQKVFRFADFDSQNVTEEGNNEEDNDEDEIEIETNDIEENRNHETNEVSTTDDDKTQNVNANSNNDAGNVEKKDDEVNIPQPTVEESKSECASICARKVLLSEQPTKETLGVDDTNSKKL